MKWMIRPAWILLLCITTYFVSLTSDAVFAQDASRITSDKLASISSIQIAGNGKNAELVIQMSSPATYTSYKTTAPLRLILDLSQATPGSADLQQNLTTGNFKSVHASRFDTDAGVLTRVEIELVQDAEAVITASPSHPGELRIAFPSLAVTETTAPAASAPVAASEPAHSEAQNSSSQPNTQSAAPVVASETVTPAEPSSSATSEIPRKTALTAISTQNNAILLVLDGRIAEFKQFRLSNPERLIIDLMDVSSIMASRIVPLHSGGIASARIGLYPDKVRVVLDSLNGSFPEARAEKTAEGIRISLTGGKETAVPESSASQPVPTAVPEKTLPQVVKKSEPKSVTAAVPETTAPVPVAKVVAAPKSEQKAATAAVKAVEVKPAVVSPAVAMIDFQVLEGLSRLAVKVQGDVKADQPVKTAGFVTLTIKNARLPKNLQRSLEAKSFASPVLRVTPLSVKSRTGFDTRIRIAMRVTAPYEYRMEGDMLYVDFKHPENMVSDKLSADIQESKPKAAPAATAVNRDTELAGELEPAAAPSIQAGSKLSYKGRKVTLEFADAEVRKIFQLLSEVSNKNFVLGDDVTGSISIKLVNVPWDQALDIILDTKGLDKREDGNIIIIKGKGKFKSQAEEEQEIKKALFKSLDLKTEAFSINYSDVASIVAQLNAVKTDRGSITQDARTNKVIVKDIAQAIDDMRKLIVQLDVPEKQVMIEARIVEATSTFTRSLGVNWGIHYRDGSASLLGINQFDSSFGGIASTAAPTSGLTGNAGGAAGFSFGTLTSNIQLDLRLNAAASAGLVKIVSTPKVATLNNKTAKITQGQQVPYTSSTSDKVETKFVEAALSLEVTPHINANGTIGMKIDAKNDSVGQATGGSTAPAINKKQATTEMLLRDGETTVIGGIYVDSDNESDDGVPYLMDIPYLGKLFRSNSKTKVKTELLIFITPRILGSI